MSDDGQTSSRELDPQELEALIKKTQADARAAEAAADQAEATARKAEAEAADLVSPSGQLARDARNLQTAAEAEQKTAAARQLQVSALIPDLSKVKDSTLDVGKDGPAIAASSLTFGAIADAAEAIAAQIDPLGANSRVLVTSDHDLATQDFHYQEVLQGLTQLADAAAALLPWTVVETVKTDERKEPDPNEDILKNLNLRLFAAPTIAAGAAAAVPVLSAVAAAVPHVLSLLSAERSVTTTAITPTDLAAAAAVSGALESEGREGVTVIHDDFRLVIPGQIHDMITLVATKRQALVGQKLDLADCKSAIDAELTVAKAQEKDAEQAVRDADPEAGGQADIKNDLYDARNRVAVLTHQFAKASQRLGLVESLISSMDTFTAAIRVTPTGGRRSPLATAALVEQLHSDANPHFTHVLLVKAQPSQATQLTEDRPLHLRDKFSTIVEVNITYMLIGTEDSHVIRAGTATSVTAAHGTLGEDIRFEPKKHVSVMPGKKKHWSDSAQRFDGDQG